MHEIMTTNTKNACNCMFYRVMDLETPRNVQLTAFYKRSFAFHTVKERLPIIVTQTIDSLTREKKFFIAQFGERAEEEIKAVIGDLSKLKYELQTNKELAPINSPASDAKFYNEFINLKAADEGRATYFNTIWLLTECYVYRRIKEAFEKTNSLKLCDPFVTKKQEAYFGALPLMRSLSAFLIQLLTFSEETGEEDFSKLIKINLWGNKCDLSLSNGTVEVNELAFDLSKLEPNIICNQTHEIWEVISDPTNPLDVVDIVLDNSGYELFTDFCLADLIISKRYAKRVNFHVKKIPWFISDVMVTDFKWTLEQLSNDSDPNVKKLGEVWTEYVDRKLWHIEQHDFWTLPVEFTYMKTLDPKLYAQLSKRKLVIFKGDLNYRKLFGEVNWDPSTPVEEALQGFHPTKLCTLRTVKADIICGLKPGVAEKCEAEDPKWMQTGNYGVIQFSGKIDA